MCDASVCTSEDESNNKMFNKMKECFFFSLTIYVFFFFKPNTGLVPTKKATMTSPGYGPGRDRMSRSAIGALDAQPIIQDGMLPSSSVAGAVRTNECFTVWKENGLNHSL